MIYIIALLVCAGLWYLSENKKFQSSFAEFLQDIKALLEDWAVKRREKWQREHPPIHFLIERTFSGQTLGGFNVLYWLNLSCERVDVAESIREQTWNPVVMNAMAYEFRDKVFLPHFESKSYFWHLDYRAVVARDRLYHLFPTIVAEVATEDDKQIVREVPKTRLKYEIQKLPPCRIYGCEITLLDFATPVPMPEVIERNFRVLSEEQKEAIMLTPQFGIAAEMLAVSLLNFRLNLLRHGSKTHKADDFTIETEKAGRSLKLKWTLGSNAHGFYLWGFRNTNGFSDDQWSETNNGMRIVDTYNDGEVVEVLQEGMAYFYTFYLRPFQPSEKVGKKSPLRFQITIETAAETKVIEEAMKRFEQREQPDEASENLANALKEIGSYVEMDTALDAMQKSFSDQIRNSDMSEEEKRRKIERLQDIVVQIRSKYEPV